MSETTERDARLRLYAEFGESRQYLGPHNDEIGARELMRADVASLLKERDALAADYAQAILALRGFIHWTDESGARIEAFVDCGYEVREARSVLSTPRAKGVE